MPKIYATLCGCGPRVGPPGPGSLYRICSSLFGNVSMYVIELFIRIEIGHILLHSKYNCSKCSATNPLKNTKFKFLWRSQYRAS